MNLKFQKLVTRLGLLTLLLIALALSLTAAQAANNSNTSEQTGRNKPFLFPLRLPAMVERSESTPLVSRLCDYIARSVRCPESAVENGTVVGYSPIGDITTEPPPNLRITFVLQQMENEVISGDGVDIFRWAFWETSSPIATEEASGPYGLPAPGPDEIWDVTFHNQIYDAIVEEGCGSTPVFPVQFDSWIEEGMDLEDSVVIGEFNATDNSTLQPNGFWNFAYTIRATGTNDGVSDFHFKGVVTVTCTNEDEL
jgi:hypothetical protein